MVKMVVTSMRRFLVRGRATPASHSWKWAMTAFFFSRQTNCNHVSREKTSRLENRTYLAEEPSNEIAKDNSVIGLVVVVGGRDGGNVPQVRLPLVLVVGGRFEVKQQDARSTLNKPSSVDNVDASIFHGLDGGGKLRVGGLNLLNLHRSLQFRESAEWPRLWEPGEGVRAHGLLVEGPDQSVAISIFGRRHRGFGLEHGVDSTDCVSRH